MFYPRHAGWLRDWTLRPQAFIAVFAECNDHVEA